MKKLIIALITGIALLALAWLAIGLLVAPPRPVESTAIQQARESATLAAIAREQEGATFWAGLLNLAGMVILCLLVATFGALCFYAWQLAKQPTNKRKLELIRLEAELSLLLPDEQGNYPVYYNRRNLASSGEGYLLPPPGNTAYPPQLNFLPGGKEVSQPRNFQATPMLVNTGGQRVNLNDVRGTGNYTVTPIDKLPPAVPTTVHASVQPLASYEQMSAPEQSEQSENKVEQSGEPLQLGAGIVVKHNLESLTVGGTEINSEHFLKFGVLLADCKKRGESKIASIEAVTGVKRGGSPAYKAYSEFWNNLPSI